MKSLLMTTALALCLSGPALAQQGQGQTGGQMGEGAQGQTRDQTRASGLGRTVSPEAVSARLVSAAQLIRKTVVTRDGERLGRVDYVIVEPMTGLVTTLLIRAHGLQGEQKQARQQGQGKPQGGQGANAGGNAGGGAPLVAMPWHAIDINLGDTGEIVAQASMRMLREVPTFTDREIAQVTSPRMIARMVEYYAPADQRMGGQQSGQPSGQQPGREAQRQGQGGGQGASGQDRGMVVGHGVVGMLAPPAVTTVDQMQGLDITLPDGRTVGQVDMVMINADTGAVSYVLAKRTGGQGGGQGGGQSQAANYVPVSYQDLELAADGQSFTLAPDALLIGVVTAPQGEAGMQGDMRGDRRQGQQARSGQQRPDGQRPDGQRQTGPEIDRAVLGIVASVDAETRMITLENGSSYRVAGGIDLNQFEPGDEVELTYRERGATDRATDIEEAPETALSGRERPDATTGLVDGTDAPGATDDIRRPPRE